MTKFPFAGLLSFVLDVPFIASAEPSTPPKHPNPGGKIQKMCTGYPLDIITFNRWPLDTGYRVLLGKTNIPLIYTLSLHRSISVQKIRPARSPSRGNFKDKTNHFILTSNFQFWLTIGQISYVTQGSKLTSLQNLATVAHKLWKKQVCLRFCPVLKKI